MCRGIGGGSGAVSNVCPAETDHKSNPRDVLCCRPGNDFTPLRPGTYCLQVPGRDHGPMCAGPWLRPALRAGFDTGHGDETDSGQGTRQTVGRGRDRQGTRQTVDRGRDRQWAGDETDSGQGTRQTGDETDSGQGTRQTVGRGRNRQWAGDETDSGQVKADRGSSQCVTMTLPVVGGGGGGGWR